MAHWVRWGKKNYDRQIIYWICVRSVSAKYQTENMFTCIVITWHPSSSLSSSSIVRRKLVQRSTALKLLGQLKPNLVTIVLRWSSLGTGNSSIISHMAHWVRWGKKKIMTDKLYTEYVCNVAGSYNFWWFLNGFFFDFIFVKIYSKFDVRKQKLSLNHKKIKAI
jgi:hypothetical protein